MLLKEPDVGLDSDEIPCPIHSELLYRYMKATDEMKHAGRAGQSDEYSRMKLSAHAAYQKLLEHIGEHRCTPARV